jgi:hypothetical protein
VTWREVVVLGVSAWVAGLPTLHAADCNFNGVEDRADILSAESEDCNANHIPDECDAVAFDFGERQQGVAVGASPAALLAVDLNGDGDKDLAALTAGANVSVLLGGGAGAFAAPVDYPAMKGAESLARGDLDGDGDVDLVAASGASLAVLRNAGDGSFAAAESSAAVSGTVFVTVADVDADGVLDLVTASATRSEVAVHLGERLPEGVRFAAASSYAVGEEPLAVVVADLDSDGALDLASANRVGGSVSVLLADGLPAEGGVAFAAAVNYAVGPLAAGATSGELLAVGDLDSDDVPELVVATSPSVAVLPNQGDGTFAEAVPFAGQPVALALGDLDADGDLDVAYGTELAIGTDPTNRAAVNIRISGLLTAVVNDGRGRLRAAASFNLEANARAVTAADLDSDGDLDLAAAVTEPDRVAVFLNAEEDAFSMTSFNVVMRHPPHGVNVGDLDGDGDVDAVMADGGEFNSYSVLFNVGGRTFRQATPVEISGTAHVTTVAVGDLDQDGDLDTSYPDLHNSVAHVVTNDGQGNFGNLQSFRTGREPVYNALGDLDGDGDLDIVTADALGNGLSVLLNEGSATFGRRVRVRSGAGPRAVVALDLDGDGDLDLAAANSGASQRERVSVHRGEGDGTFEGTGERYGLTGAPTFLQAGDFDGDGDPDLVSAQTNSAVSLLANRGDGTFAAAVETQLGFTPFAFAVADLDGDGHLDLATGNQGAGTMAVLFNDGTGTFARAFRYATGGLPRFVAAADFDGDGNMDVVCNNRIGSSLTFFFGRSPRRAPQNVLEGICADETESPKFRRGDVDVSGTLDLTDVLALLGYLFQGAAVPPCRQAADADASGRLNVVDAVVVLGYLFLGGEPLPPPFEDCDVDRSEDALDCKSFSSCL